MKVQVKGVGDVTLTQQHYVATGGQASVYIRNGVAYKIYTDPKDTIPSDKFSALSVISDQNVIKPEALILDNKNQAIGYTMTAVSNTHSLCQLFTKGFRDRSNVSNDMIIDLAAKLRTHIENVHKEDIIIVDLNELNILAAGDNKDVFLIDVDSYQTKGYPATVIMPSVRDFSVSSSKFSTLSDWFSYGVLAFQLFVGIHPYRGTHQPSMSIEKDKRLEHRMRNNLSAFRSDVSLPGCCYPLTNIPEGFKSWLKAVLDEGKRLPPPDPKQPVQLIVQAVKVVQSMAHLNITKIFSLGGTLLAYDDDGQNTLTLSKDSGEVYEIEFNGKHLASMADIPSQTVIGLSPRMNKAFGLYCKDGDLHLIDFSTKSTRVCGKAEKVVRSSHGSFHVKNGGSIFEIDFIENPTNFNAVASRSVANVLEKASTLFEGCCIQSILGSAFVSLFPRPRMGYQVRIPELDKCRVLDAKFSNGVLMVCGAVNGQYNRYVFRFNDSYTEYDLTTIEDVSPSEVNFITLESKICVGINEDAKLEAFKATKGSQGSKITDLPDMLNSATKLLKVKGKVAFEHGGDLYKVEQK